MDQSLAYLNRHAAEYGLDMNRVVLMGSSAGVDLCEIYGLIVADPGY